MLGLVIGQAGSVCAGTSRSRLRVSVALQDLLEVTRGGLLVLDDRRVNPAVNDVIGPQSDSSGRLNFTHNSAVLKKITANAASPQSGHDITLSVEIGGAGGPKPLIINGAVQPVQELMVSIPAGAVSNRTLTYTAQCTAHGTRLTSGTDFLFTVTFTSLDN